MANKKSALSVVEVLWYKKFVISISGVYRRFVFINNDNRVLSIGSNENDQLGLESRKISYRKSTEVMFFFGKKRVDAYTGSYRFLFKTFEGKIFACATIFKVTFLF